ncbi:MAG: penicillin-binding protein 2, partial [Gemmobacter sp.]|nr:penicillin-binding protein 2 [Gemmobacter sp.]
MTTRVPLRPLARILDARARGEDPDAIEAENIRLRHETMRDRSRTRAEGRLAFLGLGFFALFMVVGARMAVLAGTEPAEPPSVARSAPIQSQRADLV